MQPHSLNRCLDICAVLVCINPLPDISFFLCRYTTYWTWYTCAFHSVKRSVNFSTFPASQSLSLPRELWTVIIIVLTTIIILEDHIEDVHNSSQRSLRFGQRVYRDGAPMSLPMHLIFSVCHSKILLLIIGRWCSGELIIIPTFLVHVPMVVMNFDFLYIYNNEVWKRLLSLYYSSRQ